MPDIINTIRQLEQEFYCSHGPNHKPSVLTMDYDSWCELMSHESIRIYYRQSYELKELGPDKFMDLTVGILRSNPTDKPFIKVT